MQHLLALGHRRIAAVTGPAGWQATEDRRRGYYAALAGAGILPDAELEVEGDFEIAGGVTAGEQLLDLRNPPTAVFAFNDNLAIGVIQAARSRGLRVPEDLSVVGFDDLEFATIVTPAADDRAPAACGDGANGREHAGSPAGAPALRDAARRARNAARRPGVDRACARLSTIRDRSVTGTARRGGA